ncbi:MAG: phosphoribosylaminoimidazole-succinocarboxamide synthase, chloroplastic-like, partial [Gammaproteobacteria bacterium]|nr:phosphoribosylaminoimidazole-succinocarboxamide synthase, chloroplastic-like [Gammaproteobacteria bacterium]
TSKSNEHDQPLSLEEVLHAKFISPEQWEFIYHKAIELFEYASKIALERGLILVDTKFEFGQDAQDHIILVDECLTPDSSRYWRLDNYKQRLQQGLEPESYDKEIVRLWYAEQAKPYTDKVLPDLPDNLRDELAHRYIELYETLTGQKLDLTWKPT